MNKDAGELARKLARIQTCLRKELYEALQNNEECLDSMFDPNSYSPLVHELRDKYLSRLYLIQGLIQQLAHYSQGPVRHATRVISVAAENQHALVDLVNLKLGRLNGMKVVDVKFIPGVGSETWSALITYELNPLVTEAGEAAAWM
jgi:hypothetical protein